MPQVFEGITSPAITSVLFSGSIYKAVATNEEGNVQVFDVFDDRIKSEFVADAHSGKLAAIMHGYPSDTPEELDDAKALADDWAEIFAQ